MFMKMRRALLKAAAQRRHLFHDVRRSFRGCVGQGSAYPSKFERQFFEGVYIIQVSRPPDAGKQFGDVHRTNQTLVNTGPLNTKRARICL
ncbi:hypothetical protein [Rhodovulum sp. P5]|uniref:hypothetical protein n=1 Tax=Rhodovulum sp. P5 TaxID=1564506 RepID=UPI001561249F|nr:hypothetical protein [Rhodovulum sp. P5]